MKFESIGICWWIDGDFEIDTMGKSSANNLKIIEYIMLNKLVWLIYFNYSFKSLIH